MCRKHMILCGLRDGLWLKLWDMGVKGKMWRVLKGMYEVCRSTVLFDGEKSNVFSVLFYNGKFYLSEEI